MKQINASKVNKIARNMIIAYGENILDDYFNFYHDGKWVVQIVRKLNSIFINLNKKISNYNIYISSLQEYISYLEEVKLDDMNTVSSSKQLKSFLKDIKKYYDNYEKSEEVKKNDIFDKYMEVINKAKQFVNSYEKSCVNSFRNRFVQDQDNVNNLLNIIHENGNYVFNIK